MLSRLLPLFVISFLIGCDSGGGVSSPILSLVSGDGQETFQTQELAMPVRVRLSEDDAGKSGVRLVVTVTKGGGRILNESFETGPDGNLDIQWELGDDLEQEIRVTVKDSPTEPVFAHAATRYLYRRPFQVEDGWETGVLDLDSAGMDRIIQAVDQIRDGTYPEIHSLLIVQHDKLVLEIYNPGHNSAGTRVEYGRNVPHEAMSSTKSFRSLMMGIAMDEGILPGVDAPLFDYFPNLTQLNTGKKSDITLKHLLTMSTGLSWNEFTSGSANNLTQMYALSTPYDWASYVLGRPLAYDPGSTWVYNTGASILQANVVENASGIPWPEFVRTRYSEKVESPDPPGIGWSLGATILPRNMAKLGQVYLRGGVWKSTRIVSEEWVRESVQPRFRVDASNEYGYQWWIRPLYTSRGTFNSYSAQGNGGQFIFVVEDLDLVVVFTGGNFNSNTMYQVIPLLENFIIPGLL